MRVQAVFLGLLLPMSVAAQAATTEDQTKPICTEAAKHFAAGNYDLAYQSLLPHWPLPKEEVQNLGYQTKMQLKMAGERYGASFGAEYVATVTAGESLIRHIFLIKHEKHALKFACVFYKPNDKWLVNSVFWDDKPYTLVGVSGQ